MEHFHIEYSDILVGYKAHSADVISALLEKLAVKEAEIKMFKKIVEEQQDLIAAHVAQSETEVKEKK